jgi:chemotaxis protein methyltransferase CheR
VTQVVQAPADTLAAIASLVEAASGLRFVGGRYAEFASKAARAFATSGCRTWGDYLADLSRLSTSPLREQLFEGLTIGESYFFRHRPYFDLLERDVLPRLIADRRPTRRLRLWSAGCATGEEAYSLAILIWRLLPDLAQWDVSILATDLNATFLTQARAGNYGEWSLRGADDDFRAAYFERDGRRYQIRPWIARLVRFARLNLAEATYPSPASATSQMDLILCRNVLIYFGPDIARQVVGRLRAALTTDGWLVVGPSDSLPGLLAGFEPTGNDEALAYRRIDDAPPDSAPPLGEPALPLPATARTIAKHGDRRPVGSAPTTSPRRPRLTAPVRPMHSAATPPARSLAAATAEDWSALWQTARAATTQDDYAAAEARCRQAASQGTLRAEPYYLLGVLSQASGDESAALVAFRKALYIDRTFVPALLAVAAIYRRNGRPGRARRALARAQQALAGRPDDEQILAEEPVTVGRLREVLSHALGDVSGEASA